MKVRGKCQGIFSLNPLNLLIFFRYIASNFIIIPKFYNLGVRYVKGL